MLSNFYILNCYSVTRKSWFDSPQEQGLSFCQVKLEVFIKVQNETDKERERKLETGFT